MADIKTQTVQEKSISDGVLTRVKELEGAGEINFPKNYSYTNALKSAQLMLSDQTVKRGNDTIPVLQACTKPSVINALLDMVIQGLSPLKRQCYFIPMGNKLTLMKSYQGNVVATKRLTGVKDVFANVIYHGDEFEYKLNLDNGCKEIIKHEQKFQNINSSKILGAYAIVVRDNEPNYIEIMNIDQIKKAWGMGQGKGDTKAHNNFTDEMAKKSVINRACKRFVNTSDDSDILIDAINRTPEYDPESLIEVAKKEADAEIMIEGNKEIIDIDVTGEVEESIPEVIEAEIVEIEASKSNEVDDECDF